MNLRLIDAAMDSYKELPQDDVNRLVFFRSVWGLQAASAQDCPCSWEAPSPEALTVACSAGQHIFANAPVAIDAAVLARDAADIAACIAGKGLLEPAIAAALRELDWAEALATAGLALAGSEPAAFLDELAGGLADAGTPVPAAVAAAQVASLALRCQLEKPAQAAMRALKDAKLYDGHHPLLCPCCGSEPSLSHVGGQTSSQGRGRLLVCAQCGCTWEFQRIRCARCGQTNPGHLHYFSLEGDDAHRLYTCDDCGSYIRTLFSEKGALAPVSYEVEDVVMARLDAIAQDPRFRA